jgi:hypothetical protein
VRIIFVCLTKEGKKEVKKERSKERESIRKKER